MKKAKIDKIGSIIIPEQAQSKYAPETGIIIKCGPGCDETIKRWEGKEVMYARFAGADIDLNGERYFICQDEDILLGPDEGEVSHGTGQ